MSSQSSAENIAGLLATLTFGMEALPDELKCVWCKLVLKDACRVPCDCRLCRVCIDKVVASGAQFCPGGSQQCGMTPLSTAIPDYSANWSIANATARCPRPGCAHQCRLAEMEAHLRECPRNSVECPFRAFGCLQEGLAAAEMSGHLLRESGRHNALLMGVVADIGRQVDMLKRSEHESKKEIERLKLRDGSRGVASPRKSLPSAKHAGIAFEVQGACEHPTREPARSDATTEWIVGEFKRVRCEYDWMRLEIESIRADIECGRARLPPTQEVPGEVRRGAASYGEWAIDDAIGLTEWACRESASFSGPAPSYTLLLESANSVSESTLRVYLLIEAGPHDALLNWPLSATVVLCRRQKPSRPVQQAHARVPGRAPPR